VRALAVSIVLWCSLARADTKRPIVGFSVKAKPCPADTTHCPKTKVTERTLGYLAHVHLGDLVGPDDLTRLQVALISSELFESATVALVDAPGGYILQATLDDKMSWIIGPTVFYLPSNRAFGVGFVENDLGGRDQKLLLYGQVGTQTSIFFATFLDPAFHGTRWQYRADVYLERRQIDEYANPPGNPRDQTVVRSTEETFLDGGFLVGYALRWYLVADARLRAAYVYFRNPVDPATGSPAARPESDGWDTTLQMRLTYDPRVHNFGVTTGPYLQLEAERSVPGLDTFGYVNSLARAYYSWELFCEHELELRAVGQLGYHLPIHEDNALGGASDLRGYALDQFRGDTNLIGRAEYSVPLFKVWILKFRALGFYDTGYSTFNFPRADRNYLPGQLDRSFFRNDVGIGLRAYVKAVVLPLLGIDLGYGIEGHSPEVYFELGLTDF
jgi:outer membrane protein assembly factor BamA